jgi:hypothetical protein
MRYAALFVLIAVIMLTGCTPHHEMIQHGNQKILFSQTQNVWTDNVLLVTPCKEKLANGQCDPDGPTQVTTATGKGAGIVGGVGGGVVSALIIRDGLIKSKANVKQNNQTDIRASTVNPK